MHIIIAGGGIGGLTAGIGLHRAGIDVTVLEQAKVFSEVGAGIQIAANGSLVLRQFGLENKIAELGVEPQSYDFRDMDTGKMLYVAPLGPDMTERYGAPLYNIHRADLIETLGNALPSGSVRFNSKCVGYEQDSSGVTVTLSDGSTLRGDALIGADGIHSAVRHQMKGEEDTHFANILMWRSLVPAEKLDGLNLEERGNYWIGPGRTLITYWVRSQNLYSILASVPAQEVQKESWAESGDVNSMLQSFEDIDPRARKMLEACETNFVTGMYYRDPIDSWCDGRVTLLGDAAHPMVPFLAQGACQSMEDAWVLTSVLSQSEKQNIPAALMEYEQRRRPRTARVQSGARAMVKLVHESDPERIIARNGRWRGTTRIDPLAETTWGWVWDYDVIKASQEPAGKVQGLTGVQEGKRMERPESQRAFDIWKSAFTAEDIAGGHDGMRAGYDRMLTTYFPPLENCLTEEIELGTTTAVRVSAPGSDTIPSATILHFHGGGYVIGSANGSIEYASRLAELVGGDCISVDYRLAPEHPYPAAIIDALDAYRSLLANGTPAQTIILSGESSGAGLALALAQAVKRAGDPLPAGIIAVCPFANLTLSGETVREFSEVDPAANRDFLTFLAASYFQTHEPTDPMVSPVYGDFTGLPPIFVTASEGEALLSDSLQVIEMARASGVHVTEKIVTDSVHVFPIFPFLPETKEVMNSIGDWCSLQLQNSDISTVPTDQSERIRIIK